MKAISHKIVTTLLALLVLLSTVSWTVDKHFCMGRVMDIAFFHSAEDCGMEAALKLLEINQEESHCCGDESFTLKGQDDLQKVTWQDLDFRQQWVLHSYVFSFLDSLNSNSENELTVFIDPPPLLKKDFQELYQIYII